RHDEFMGRPLRELVHPDDRRALENAIGGLVAQREAKHKRDYRFLRADGGEVWIVLTLSLLRDRHDRAVQLTIMEDVSEQKRMAASLKVTEALFQRLEQSGMLGIAFAAEDGTVTKGNDAFLDIVGWSRDDLEA